jgi:hypothetical protein
VVDPPVSVVAPILHPPTDPPVAVTVPVIVADVAVRSPELFTLNFGLVPGTLMVPPEMVNPLKVTPDILPPEMVLPDIVAPDIVPPLIVFPVTVVPVIDPPVTVKLVAETAPAVVTLNAFDAPSAIPSVPI